ncbi:MAG: hypothetical protein ACMUIE_00375 [Thermoplasmatota archaeon]
MAWERGLKIMKVLLLSALLVLPLLTFDGLEAEGGDPGSAKDAPILIEWTGNHTVTSTETYSSETIHLHGNLSIFGTLILDGTDLTINSTFHDLKLITVHDGAVLVLRNGSSISTMDDSRFVFRANRSTTVTITSSTIRGCGVFSEELWQSGLYSESGLVQIVNSEILEGYCGIVGNGSRINVQGSNISMMEHCGAMLVENSVMNASIINITQCQEAGIHLDGSALNLSAASFGEVMYSIQARLSNVKVRHSILASQGIVSCSFNSTAAFVSDSSPSPTGGDMMAVEAPSAGPTRLELLNTTFRDVMVEDPLATVVSLVRYDVLVLTNDRAPAPGADVDIRDRDEKLVFHGLTDQNGGIYDIRLPTIVFNVTGSHPTNPLNLSVMYDGGERYKDFDPSRGYAVEIHVIITQPEVIIDYPEEGMWLPTNDLHLTGRVEDSRPITDLWLSIDGSPDLNIPAGNTFSIPLRSLNLPDGQHRFMMVAKNDDGKYGVLNRTFGIDTVLPVITVTSPESPFYTNQSNLLIEGTCSIDSKIYIGEVEVHNVDGSFIYSYPLEEGRNEVMITAVDRAGNSVNEFITAFRDTSPPTILLFSPLDRTRTNERSIMVMGSTDQDTVLLTVNGAEVELDNGRFETEISLDREGENTIRITAQDRTGTRSIKHLRVIRDTTPPSLSITNAPTLTNSPVVTIRGTTDPGSTLLVNNLIVPAAGGAFQVELELYEGENTIVFISKDDLNNQAVVNWTVMLDTVKPSFVSIMPASGSKVTNPILEIRGEVFDESGIEKVMGRTDDGTYQVISTNEEWTWVVTLEDGQNIFDLEVTDKAGNVLMGQILYELQAPAEEDTEPPVVWISSPRSNSSHPAGTIKVEGAALDNDEVASVLIRVEEGPWMEVAGLESWYVYIQLEKGIYTLEVMAEDASGNNATDSIWISVYIEPTDKPGDGKKDSNWPIYLILTLFIIALAGIFIYMLVIRMRSTISSEGQHPPSDRREGPEHRSRPRKEAVLMTDKRTGKQAVRISEKGRKPRRVKPPSGERS